VTTADMVWFGEAALAGRGVIPLAVLEQPCRFREAAIRALEDAGRSFRITVETPNLTTLRAAVEAGLGLTVRTPPFLPDAQLDSTALPALPRVSCILLTASGLDGATGHLADLARRTVAAL
jgi:DNA-binding transcriptional LysR family regulator